MRCGSARVEPVRVLASLASLPPLESPVLISGSSVFGQLPQLVQAIRGAPTVGARAWVRGRGCEGRGRRRLAAVQLPGAISMRESMWGVILG
jgi:hypothetical protein